MTRIRRSLVALLVVSTLAFGGCLTVGPTVEADTGGSAVFDRVSATESWSGTGVRTAITLKSTPAVEDVTTISVVDESGRTFLTTTVHPGQTRVVVSLPAQSNATVVASDSVNSSTVEKLNVTVGGNAIP
ncbi:hypothetical protein NDI76_13230 [Halogeometricum sp. S1BR25-6]|uniref:Lipoprotein n=1 Tax=Halogeometricum salsisoli TaxID=2950536 RepID=A0ABU2GG06_9EURY|nr:hypothetical protein [Halogeometricum sp. S1BR25-6]MDS0299705.1 hypothetical protein [Halogeometricum sp. S1BR25-6]